MIGRLAALILLSALSQTQEAPQQMSLTVAEHGDTVTMICSLSTDETGLFYWYKLNFGYLVQTVAAGTFEKIALKEDFKSRFTVTRAGAQYFLNITNVSKEDEATYFCQAGTAYTMRMINGTLLAVNDPNDLQKSVYVKQSPETTSVEPGDSVTLQCSLLSKNEEKRDQCPGEHSVYWFKAGVVGFNPGVIYTHSISRHEQEERGCGYSLSKTIHNSSDAGTYYCAVVTCGEILFGKGTKVETRQELWPLFIVLGILLACCVIVIVGLILSRKQKPVCVQYKGEITASNLAEHDQPRNMDGETAPVNYVVLDFPSRKAKRWKNTVELPEESLYTLTKD